MIGRTFGHYRIVAAIGAGGMGEVYRARDERLDRDVALKVLPAGLLADEAAVRRFRREALALSKLNHPNIATVHDFDSQEGVSFLVMELVDGVSLASKIERGPIPEPEAVSLAAQIADGLDAAHARGIVHRDLKPGNVALTADGRVKVIDFGLARPLRPPADTAATTSIADERGFAGTPAYMAPEQLRGEAPDTRSDIFSIGVLLYEMAAGRRPFTGTLLTQLADAILNRPPVAPRTLNASISPEFERIILKCLEKDPELRYQSARELRVDLRRLGAPPAVPADVGTGRRSGRWGGWVKGLAAGLVLAAGGAAAVALNLGGVRDQFGNGALPRVRSLAVLPMANLSRDPEQEYFADGMTEALTTELAQFSDLKVISRTSAMQYKGARKSVPDIARELNVDAVVEGSVQRSGQQVAIHVQLIHAATDRHLWAKQYQRDLSDVLSLEREVAGTVAAELRVQLTPQERSRLARARTVSPEAHQLYLQGRYAFEKWTPDGTRQAREFLQNAVRIDPDYAEAYAALADTYVFGAVTMPPKESLPLAKAMAERALALDPSLGAAHAALAEFKFLAEWDWPGAEAEFRRAIDLGPSYAEVRHMYSHFLIGMGRLPEALAQSQRLLEIDPLSPVAHDHLGYYHLIVGDYGKAIEESNRALALDPGFASTRAKLADAYAGLGRYKDAVDEYEKALPSFGVTAPQLAELRTAFERSGWRGHLRKRLDFLLASQRTDYVAPTEIAQLYALLDENDRAFEWLDRALAVHDDGLVYIKSPEYPAGLRADPRYRDLLRRLRLPE